jgi:dimethylhistidine N-methyltransferase
MPVETARSARLVIDRTSAPQGEDDFANDVRAGLTARPKRLAPKYFYDALGSHLFEAICHLPEYYLTRAETEILSSYSAEMVRQVSGGVNPVNLVELGSGSAVKSRYLIRSLLETQSRLHYQPIDISASMLGESSTALLNEFSGLRITAVAGDYTQGMNLIQRQSGERVLVLFLGSNIGNYDPDESRALIGSVRASLQPADALLLGADLKKPAEVLEAAYDDALGVTAAFNLNLLVRINRELGGEFDVSRFAHRALYNDLQDRVEMHLESTVEQDVEIGALGLRIRFAEGETIHTESSYKYNESGLRKLAEDTGFTMARSWIDARGQFSCNLWLAV